MILKHKILKISNIQVEGEGGYIDVEKFISLRYQLKGPKRDKGVGDHLRIGGLNCVHSPLTEGFYKLIAQPPKWMIKDIDNQLSYFKNTVHIDIDKLIVQFSNQHNWKECYLLAHYKIKKGRVYVKDYSMNHNTLQYMNAALVRLVKSIEIPDLEFVISFHDSLDLINISAPIFCQCKRQGNPFIIVIPEHEILTGYEKNDAKIDKAVHDSPWEKKKDMAFWRGSTTSGDYHLPNWRTFPRTKLVMMSKENKLIDAKFSLYVQGAETNQELLEDTDVKGDFIYPEDSLGYKYLIDIDGNASTYSRFYWILRSNCVPLKQMSTFQMWFYPALTPFVHYIPYQEDLSDFSKMLNWARSQPKKSQEIANHGRNFILNELTQDHAYTYLYLLLVEYSKL